MTHDNFVAAVVKEFKSVYGDGGKGVREVREDLLGEEKDEVEREAGELKVSHSFKPFLRARERVKRAPLTLYSFVLALSL